MSNVPREIKRWKHLFLKRWEYAAYIWLYATVWFFFNDLVKVAVYRLLHKNESDVKGA